MLKEKNDELAEVVHHEKDKHETYCQKEQKFREAGDARISELEASIKVLSKENESIPALTREISILQSMIDSNAGLSEKITLLEKENSNLSASVKALESEERKNISVLESEKDTVYVLNKKMLSLQDENKDIPDLKRQITALKRENESNQERFELSKRQDSETITNLHKQLNENISSENDSITTLSETFKYLQKKNSALPGLNSNTDHTSLDDKIASLRIENNFVDNRIHSLTRPNISAMDRELENRSIFDKELSSDEKIINYEKKLMSLFQNIVDLIDSEAINKELDDVNDSVKNTVADKIERYRSLIEHEIIVLKTEIYHIYKKLTMEVLAHNITKSELIQSTAQQNILLQRIDVLADQNRKLRIADQWKQVRVGLLVLKGKYQVVLLKVSTLEEENFNLLIEKKSKWSHDEVQLGNEKVYAGNAMVKEKEQCHDGWNI